MISDVKSSWRNFGDSGCALLGLGRARSSQVEPAAPVIGQSKFLLVGASRAGAEVSRIDEEPSCDSPDCDRGPAALCRLTPVLVEIRPIH